MFTSLKVIRRYYATTYNNRASSSARASTRGKSPPTASDSDCKSKSKLCYDLRSVGQSVLVSGTHRKPMIRSSLLSREIQICWYGAPYLTRGRVCTLQLLLSLAKAIILGSGSRRTHDHILLPQIYIFIFPRNMNAQFYPQAQGNRTASP
jgi:hypothetical protein